MINKQIGVQWHSERPKSWRPSGLSTLALTSKPPHVRLSASATNLKATHHLRSFVSAAELRIPSLSLLAFGGACVLEDVSLPEMEFRACLL